LQGALNTLDFWTAVLIPFISFVEYALNCPKRMRDWPLRALDSTRLSGLYVLSDSHVEIPLPFFDTPASSLMILSYAVRDARNSVD
jgi:hypothetical protein